VREEGEIIERLGYGYARTWREKAGIATVEGLLEVGRDGVKELRHRVPEHLYQTMSEGKKLVRRVPALSQVED